MSDDKPKRELRDDVPQEPKWDEEEQGQAPHRPERSIHFPHNLGFQNPNLMPDELAKTIPPLYSQENVRDPMAGAKFFTPDSSWTWYVVEHDPKSEGRVAWGLVYGHEAEVGPFSIEEMENARGPMGLPIERDEHWKPRPLSKCEDPTHTHENPLKPTLKHKL